MRPGLRLQILLLLGGLLLLTFVPLYFTVSTYIRIALDRSREEALRDWDRALVERLETTPLTELRRQLEHELDHPALRRTAFGEDRYQGKARPLLVLLGLYMGLVGLALLVLAYFALTRIIVRPLDTLAQAAQRVATGARKLETPTAGAYELAELGSSLARMTERLLTEEAALRRKIDEVEQATKELRTAQDQLVRSERLASVGRLAAGLAHEIGNPIAALMGMEDLLLSGGLSSEEQRDFLLRMRKETERVHHILRDLLQFARPEPTPASDLETRAGDLNQAIDDTLALLTIQEGFDRIEFRKQLPPSLSRVALPREHLVQVLMNLMLNAADACVHSAVPLINVAASANGPEIELVIEDNGPGVDPRILPRLFEPFATTKEVGRGTGLGLAVCRGLVEAVGGSISLASTSEKGTSFLVRLPVVVTPA